MTLKLALSRSRPSVPYGANFRLLFFFPVFEAHFHLLILKEYFQQSMVSILKIMYNAFLSSVLDITHPH